MAEETETIYTRVPKDLVVWLRERAAEQGRSMAGEMARIIQHAQLCDHQVIPTPKQADY